MPLQRMTPSWSTASSPRALAGARTAGWVRCLPVAVLVALVLSTLGHRAPTALVQSVALDALPTALALDPATHRAFVLTSDGVLHILDLRHPSSMRRVPVAGTASSATLALDERDQRLFVAEPDLVAGRVYVLDSRNGALRATVSVGQGTISLAVDAPHGQVFVATTGDGTVRLLDARSGRRLRTIRLGDEPVGLALDPHAAHAVVLSKVTAWAGAYPTSGRLSLLDSRSGRLLRRVALAEWAARLALDTPSGHAFIANSTAGTVSVLDSRSGARVRTVAVGAGPTDLAVDEPAGLVVVLTAGDHILHILDARTGRLLHTTQLDAGPTPLAADPYAADPYAADPYAADPYAADPDTMAVDTRRGWVYVARWGRLDASGHFVSPGTLSVVEARTGALLRRFAVGATPLAVAVDERSGRVVVASGGGAVLRPADDVLAQGSTHLRAWVPWLGHLVPPPRPAAWVSSSVSVIEAGS